MGEPLSKELNADLMSLCSELKLNGFSSLSQETSAPTNPIKRNCAFEEVSNAHTNSKFMDIQR